MLQHRQLTSARTGYVLLPGSGDVKPVCFDKGNAIEKAPAFETMTGWIKL
jgi:hypothetical protein